MSPKTRSARTVDEIEKALVQMRRSMARRNLQRRSDPDASALSGALFQVLDALDDRERGLSITEIASALGVDQPRASRLVAIAVDRGLVCRSEDPTDARRKHIDLTIEGRKHLAATHDARRVAVAAAIVNFSSVDAEAFARLLTAFIENWRS